MTALETLTSQRDHDTRLTVLSLLQCLYETFQNEKDNSRDRRERPGKKRCNYIVGHQDKAWM